MHKQRATVLVILLGLSLFLSLAARAEQANFYTVDYYTDVTGGATIAFNSQVKLSSANVIRAGASWMDAKTTALGKGASVNLGFGSDRDKKFFFDSDWTYWRFPGNVPDRGLDVLIINNGLSRSSGDWVVALNPLARNLRFVNAGGQTIIASMGLGYSASYYSRQNWSLTVGGEESRYYGNATIMQTIFNALRSSGNAPFVSSLNITRQFLEVSFQRGNSVFGIGYDRSKVVITPNKFSQSLYVDYSRELNPRWQLRTSLGAGSLDGSDWFGSVGFTYNK